MALEPDYGETLLEEEDAEALLPAVRAVLGRPVLKADVYDLEQRIQEDVADRWWNDLLNWNIPLSQILSDDFLRELHRDLFGSVWEWGGRQRSKLTNIGIDPEHIAVETRVALGNLLYRWQHEKGLTPRWLGIAAHADLVRIHPFVDGNGRVTRLFAELVYLATQDGLEPLHAYDWEIDRTTYLRLLREYDQHWDPKDLVELIPVINLEELAEDDS